MFRCTRALFAALTLALMAAAPAAYAKVVQFTVEGTVTRAVGNASMFGLSNADLVGMDYVAVFRFDTSVGYRLRPTGFDTVFGGYPNDVPSPSLGGSLTINGVTLSMPGALTGVASTGNAGQSGRTIQSLRDVDEFAGSHAVLYSEIRTSKPGSLSVSLDAPFTYQVDPLDQVTSYYDFQYAEQDDCCLTIRSAVGTLKPRSVRLETLGVPEPSTWALLIGGFAAVGVVVRRRRALIAV